MLSFETIIDGSWSGVDWALLALADLSFCSFALSWTASLITSMSSAAQSDSTNTHTLWWLNDALMTDTC